MLVKDKITASRWNVTLPSPQLERSVTVG